MIEQPNPLAGTRPSPANGCRSGGFGEARRSRKLLHAFPTFTIGGAQIRFAQLANAFNEHFEHVANRAAGD